MDASEPSAALDGIADQLTRADIEIGLEALVTFAKKLAGTRKQAAELASRAQTTLASWRNVKSRSLLLTTEEQRVEFNKHLTDALEIIDELRTIGTDGEPDENKPSARRLWKVLGVALLAAVCVVVGGVAALKCESNGSDAEPTASVPAVTKCRLENIEVGAPKEAILSNCPNRAAKSSRYVTLTLDGGGLAPNDLVRVAEQSPGVSVAVRQSPGHCKPTSPASTQLPESDVVTLNSDCIDPRGVAKILLQRCWVDGTPAKPSVSLQPVAGPMKQLECSGLER